MDEVSLVRERTDLVNLIGSYITLKKMGSNFKAACPFHNETTPSFVVSPERQIWHCFGCGKGGDCFSFLMEYDHIDFPEALRSLAQKAGVTLSRHTVDSHASQKELLYQINSLACEYYHFLLTKHVVGAPALAYTQTRHILPQTLDTYMLGFAPPSGTALVSYLMQKKNYKAQDILDAGLATKRMGGIVDFFSNRLIFPLYDHRGNIIGFSGRILTGDTNTSKYINTRETLLYHKGSVFFGLNSSKEAIKKENKAIIMEGELDVIAAFQEGITNVVAIKGTALTLDQVNLLSRFTTNISLCLDSDKAGQEAMKRSLPLLEQKNMTTTLIKIPGGKDPDEALKSDPITFKKAIKHARGVYDEVLDMLITTYDPKTAAGKKEIGSQMLTFISYINNEIVKEHYLRLLSQKIATSEEVLLKELGRIHKKDIIKTDTIVTKEVKTREEMLEEYLTALFVQHKNPKQLLALLEEFLTEYGWIIPVCQKILQQLHTFTNNHNEFRVEEFLTVLPQEDVAMFDECFLLPLPTLTPEQYMEEVLTTKDELQKLFYKHKVSQLTAEMKEREKLGDEEGLATLETQLAKLIEKLS